MADAADTHHASRNDSADLHDLLEHGSFLGDKRDAGGRIEEQQQPERPPLPCPECAAERVVLGRTLRSLRGRGRPTLGLPPLGWVLHEVTSDHDYDQIANAQISKSLKHANTLD